MFLPLTGVLQPADTCAPRLQDVVHRAVMASSATKTNLEEMNFTPLMTLSDGPAKVRCLRRACMQAMSDLS